MPTWCPSLSPRSPRSQRQRRPQLSLLQRLWSLPQSLRRRLRRLLCPRRPPSEEAARPEARTRPTNPRKVCRHRGHRLPSAKSLRRLNLRRQLQSQSRSSQSE